MAKIDLLELYPTLKLRRQKKETCVINVPNEIAEEFVASLNLKVARSLVRFERNEKAYYRKLYENKAHYSLDQDDGIENEMLLNLPSLIDEHERKLTTKQLYIALEMLPAKQAKRIYAHFFMGMSKVDIAKAEGVDEKVVRIAITRGIEKLKNILKNF